MNLSQIVFGQSAKIPVPGGDIAVRGLSLHDIMALVAEHREPLEAAFKTMAADGDRADQIVGSPNLMGAEMLNALPDVATHVLSIASDLEGDIDLFKKLPIGLQLAMLEKIFELTASDGGLGKVIEIVTKAVNGTKDVVGQMSALQP